MVDKTRVGIVGKGNVGSALAEGLGAAGYEVRTVGRDPQEVAATAHWAEIVILAVPFVEVDDAVRNLQGGANGKPLVDVTNALTPDYEWALGYTTSGAEELQRKAPQAKVVKAFNTIFAVNQTTGQVKGERLTALVASDDDEARHQVLSMAEDIGFDAVDAGPLRNARLLEPLGYLNIQLGYTLEMGTGIGFRLVH